MLIREDEEALKAAAKLHHQWGLRFTVVGNYVAATEAFRRSLQEGGENMRGLIGLCLVLLKTGNYEEADKISARCIEIEPDNYEAKWMRIKTLYESGEFERSLVYAHRGYRQRRLPFEIGLYQARETIENSIGHNTADNVLIELIPWMKKLEEQRRNTLIAKLSMVEDEFEEEIHAEHAKYRVNDLEYQKEYRIKKFKRMLITKYEKVLARDTYFLENLVENSQLHSMKNNGNRNLLGKIQDYLMRSNEAIELARMRKPLYVFHLKKTKIMTPSWKKEKLNERELRKFNIIMEVNCMMMKLHNARIKRNYRVFFRSVERAKCKLDTYPKSLFSKKAYCLSELYKMVARAYIDPRDVTGIKNSATRERYLKHHLGIRMAVLPRDEDLAWIPCGPVDKKLKIFRKRLALTSEPLELAWLYHEFSKLHLETMSLDLARFYSKKSRDWSYQAGDDWWMINANHLLIRIELQHRNKNEAKEAAILCALGGKKIGLDYLVDFYVKVIRFIEKFNLESMKGLDAITIREKLITNLMPTEKLKCETEYLFQRMNVVPAKRRLSLVPGCKTLDKIFKLPCKRNTIRVNPGINLIKEFQRKLLRQYAPSRSIPGWMDFQDYR